MLQVSRPGLHPSIQNGAEGLDEPTLRERCETYWQFCRRHYPLMAAVFLCVMALSAIYLLTATPMFTGVADLIIDTRRSPIVQQQSPMPDQSSGFVDSAMIDSQVEVLRSENVALGVIRDLDLLDDTDFMAPSSGLLGAILSPLVAIFGDGTPPSRDELTRDAVTRLQDRLTIKRLGTTYVIEISFKANNPLKAAQIANAFANAYVADSLEAKYQISRRAGTWLQDRLTELRAQAKEADRTVVNFKARNRIIESGGRLMNEQQVAELNSSLTTAKGLAADAQARVDRINAILSTRNDGVVLDAAATVTDTLHNDVVTRLRSQYLDIAAREAEWSSKYGAKHLAAINLRSQMAEIRRSINDELRRIAETYKSDYEIAKTRVVAVERDLNAMVEESNATNQAQIALRDLDSTAQSYRALADNFLQLFMQSVQQQSFPITESRLITSATPATKKSSPRASVVFAIGIVLASILAVAAALVRDLIDRVFRTSAQVEQRLKVGCLAVVPHLEKNRTIIQHPRSRDDRLLDFDIMVSGQVLNEPFSRYTEAVRAVKVAHELQEVEQSGKVLGVTSSLPNEGKSTTATSIALAISAPGSRKVILVDCDLRNPALTRQLAPYAEKGLLELVGGDVDLNEVIWKDQRSGLFFLPTVVKDKVAYTSDILASKAMRKLFDKLSAHFDTIVVDLPPVAPVVDVRATCKFVDSYVFVVEWGATKFSIVERALKEVPEIYNNLLGVVLNKADLSVADRYESVQGNYYQNRYYSDYVG